jgi:hypothetical protein
LLIAAILDDSADHEIKSTPGNGSRARLFNARKKDQVLEIKAKKLLGSFLGRSTSPYKFAWENDSKALAFCAARSHIVAVR